jgi:hypothetical protein
VNVSYLYVYVASKEGLCSVELVVYSKIQLNLVITTSVYVTPHL